MSEINYPKKLIQPLIDKYAINAKKNTTFKEIIKMFDGKPNYQFWGVKVVFDKVLTLDKLAEINNWLNEYPGLKSKLRKQGNITCYTTKEDMCVLSAEMDGLCKKAFVKKMINMFNTHQRKAIAADSLIDIFDGYNIKLSMSFMKWYGIFKRFNNLPEDKKHNVISKASALDTPNLIYETLEAAVTQRYDWNKESLISFIKNNTPNSKVVIEGDNFVVVNVSSYEDSRTLCLDCTKWCITTQSDQWRRYVSESRNKQYFLFDFSRDSSDELAYIGFTVSNSTGFIAAHSKNNTNMLDKNGDSLLVYNSKIMTIQNALENNGISIKNFIKLNTSCHFDWNTESIMKFLSESDGTKVVYNNNNRIIANVTASSSMFSLSSHTLFSSDNTPVGSPYAAYVVFDLNKKYDDEKAMVFISFKEDDYKSYTLKHMYDIYGSEITKTGYFSEIGITPYSFLPKYDTEPSIMLHKMIDCGDEDAAIKLMDESKDSVDVNLVLKDKTPIVKAINANMPKLVGKIITRDDFNSPVDDSYGESLIQSLLYAYYRNDTIKFCSDTESKVREMITVMVDSGKFDLNFVDFNGDTLINIACTDPNMLWLVEKLCNMGGSININCRNDCPGGGWTAVGNAIRYKNIEAIKLLSKHPDFVLTDAEWALANKKNVPLEECISSHDDTYELIKKNPYEANGEMSDVFTTTFYKR